MPYGVPQGSNLGPLLFLIYINDLPPKVDCITKLYADDSCLLVNAANPYQLETIINNNLKQMHEWTTANLITVNPIKSSIIIIPPKRRQVLPNFNIHINSSKILVHESAKYLGIHLDCHINFRQHINFLESKIARSVGILTKLKHVLPEKALISLYYALVSSHLLYGLTVWSGISKRSLDKLNTLQNKAVKIVAGAKYFDHVTPHYSNLKILKLPDLYKYEITKTMYRCVPYLTIFLFIIQICLSKDQIYTLRQGCATHGPRATIQPTRPVNVALDDGRTKKFFLKNQFI